MDSKWILQSAFKLSNRRGFFVPSVNIQYGERGTNIMWNLVCGGTRAYIVRFGSPLLDDPQEQAADSHFMVRRVTSSLVLGWSRALPTEGMWSPVPSKHQW